MDEPHPSKLGETETGPPGFWGVLFVWGNWGCAKRNVSLGHAYVFVRAAIIEEIVVALGDRAFHEHHVWNLADLFPVFLWTEDGFGTAQEEMARILAVEDGEAGAIDIFVGGEGWAGSIGRAR